MSTIDEAVDFASAVDISKVYFDKDGKGAVVLLVWGNSPEELVADASMAHDFDKDLDAATGEVFPEDDADLSPEQLDDKYSPKGDGEHPRFTRADWREQVLQQHTVTGYWAWVSHMLRNE